MYPKDPAPFHPAIELPAGWSNYRYRLTKCQNMIKHIFVKADWYLSSHGQDTPSCGESESLACRTLDWLLHRFYDTSNNTSLILQLVSDMIITVDPTLMVSSVRDWLIIRFLKWGFAVPMYSCFPC